MSSSQTRDADNEDRDEGEDCEPSCTILLDFAGGMLGEWFNRVESNDDGGYQAKNRSDCGNNKDRKWDREWLRPTDCRMLRSHNTLCEKEVGQKQ